MEESLKLFVGETVGETQVRRTNWFERLVGRFWLLTRVGRCQLSLPLALLVQFPLHALRYIFSFLLFFFLHKNIIQHGSRKAGGQQEKSSGRCRVPFGLYGNPSTTFYFAHHAHAFQGPRRRQ